MQGEKYEPPPNLAHKHIPPTTHVGLKELKKLKHGEDRSHKMGGAHRPARHPLLLCVKLAFTVQCDPSLNLVTI